MRHISTTLLALGVSALVSCESQLSVEVGEVVTYKHSPQRTPCGGTLAYLDAYSRYAAEQLAVSNVEKHSITYHWITPDIDITDVADIADSGCETRQGGQIFCSIPHVTHELVHAVAQQLTIPPNTFFAEGLAITLESDLRGKYPRLTTGNSFVSESDILEILTDKIAGEDLYFLGASFVSHLIYHHGMESFRDFYERLNWCSSKAKIRSTFLEVYGQSLESAIDEMFQLSGAEQCETGNFPIIPFECGAPEVESKLDKAWHLSGTLRCSDPTVVGGGGDAFRNWTINIETAGTYRISGPITTRDYSLNIGSCQGCPFERRIELGEHQSVKDVFLAPGQYFVQFGWALSVDYFDIDIDIEYLN